jgi:hypothetical protein
MRVCVFIDCTGNIKSTAQHNKSQQTGEIKLHRLWIDLIHAWSTSAGQGSYKLFVPK